MKCSHDYLHNRKAFVFICAVNGLVILIVVSQFHIINFERRKRVATSKHLHNASIILPVAKIIHQSWKTSNLPDKFRLYRRSWRTCYPKWKHMLWTDATNRVLVKKHFPWFLQTYDNLPHKICRADAVRYVYLYVFGGVYADLDTDCVRPFTHLLNHSIVLGAMEGKSQVEEGHVQNSFMYSIPRHPLWLKMLRYIADTKHARRARPEQITGPGALMTVLEKHSSSSSNDVFVYPPKYFNPFSWMNNKVKACKTREKMTATEYDECKKAYPNSYVIQYHAHTWEK